VTSATNPGGVIVLSDAGTAVYEDCCVAQAGSRLVQVLKRIGVGVEVEKGKFSMRMLACRGTTAVGSMYAVGAANHRSAVAYVKCVDSAVGVEALLVCPALHTVCVFPVFRAGFGDARRKTLYHERARIHTIFVHNHCYLDDQIYPWI
jgi:hypothetical protein